MAEVLIQQGSFCGGCSASRLLFADIMEPSEQSGPDSGSQDVNPVFLQQLRELDIPEEAAKQVGLYNLSVHLISCDSITFL